MHSLRSRFAVALVLLAVTTAPATIRAQTPSGQTHNQFTLEANVVGGAVGFAAPVGHDKWFGAQLGVGGDWLGRTIAGNPHFVENGGDQLVEIGHLALFYRQRMSTWITVDAGARIAPALHGNDLDDDPALGAFAGAYVAPMLTWRRLSAGPRIMAGMATEFDGATGFAFVLAPLTVRVTLGK